MGGIKRPARKQQQDAEEPNKIREGPKPRKGKSWSGTAEGVTGTSTPYFGKCDLVEVGGSAPSLRAFRMNPGRTEENHGMHDASYVGERSTSGEGRIPYHAEGHAKGRGKAAMQQVVIPKAQSVHVDATLKVTVNVENAEAPCQEQGAVLKTGEVGKTSLPGRQRSRKRSHGCFPGFNASTVARAMGGLWITSTTGGW